MPEVEDVPRPPAGERQDVACFPRDDVEGGEQDPGIEIALDAAAADPGPGLVEREAPVDADDVAPGPRHGLEEMRGGRAEVDGGHPGGGNRLEDAPAVGEDRRLVGAHRQRPGPGIEELDHLGARLDLRLQVADRHLGQRRHEAVPEIGLAVEQRLGARELLGGLALDHVRGNGEGAAREAHDRRGAIERPAHEADRLEEIGCRLTGIDDAQRGDVGLITKRRVDDRADPGIDREGDAHADERQHDVGVHHRRVDSELLDRHQCHLGAQIRRSRDREDVVGLAESSVACEAPPGLAHEPDRGAVGGLTPGGREHALGPGHPRRIGRGHAHEGSRSRRMRATMRLPTRDERGTFMNSTMQDMPLSITALFRRGADVFPDSEVITFEGERARHTPYAVVAERAQRLAAALQALGVVPGDRVGTLCWNHQEHIEAYIAVPCMGAVLHTLNLRLPPAQLAQIINHAQDRVVIVDNSLAPLLAAVIGQCPSIEKVIVVGAGDVSGLGEHARVRDAHRRGAVDVRLAGDR